MVMDRDAGAGSAAARRDLLLDLAERLLILGLFGWLFARFLAAFLREPQAAGLLWLVSEGIVVLLFLIRRPAAKISERWSDWTIALGATIAPLFFDPSPEHALLNPQVGAAWVLIGFFIQIHAKLCLGRSMGCVPAHRGLKRSGPYQFVRHPMYLGYCLADSGLVLMNPSLRNLGLLLLGWALLVPRLFAEERFLQQDPEYRDYVARVRARLIPGVF